MNVSGLFDASAPWSTETPRRVSPVLPQQAPEDSARFSLEHLAEVAGGPCQPATGTLRPAQSGVIDLSALRDSIRSTPHHRPASSLVDPAGRLLHGASTPIPPPSHRLRWLYGVIGLLSGALVMMLVAAVWTPDQVAMREPAPPHAGQLALAEAEWALTEGDVVSPGPVIPRTRRVRTTSAPGATAPQTNATPAETIPPARGTRGTARTSRRSGVAIAAVRPVRDAATPANPPQSTTTQPVSKPRAKPERSELSVDCILDPSSCDRGTKATPSQKPTAQRGTTATPTKLSSTQIKTALAKVKREARVCREMHGAATGTKVTVRLSIDGATGKVRSATAQAPHANSLGRCVSKHLAEATFPRFSNAAMGVIYSVRM